MDANYNDTDLPDVYIKFVCIFRFITLTSVEQRMMSCWSPIAEE